jgi:branched-subunit amino acid aminotransferase/4-amino-4-deoxychorismate lyase
MNVVLCDGRVAGADDLRTLALRNYGHFTVMQVRGRAVRGFDLHLQRLRDATRELFDVELDDARVIDGLRRAFDVAAIDDCTARVSVCAPAFDFRDPLRTVEVDVIVAITGPGEADPAALRVKSFRYERAMPQVKHVGTFPLFHFAREARRAGYDDALFVAGDGRVSEGSTWNLGLWDGEGVVWPEAPALRGTMEQLLATALAEAGIAQARRSMALPELAGFKGAFATNSRGIQPVSAIDDVRFDGAPGLPEWLAGALRTRSWQPV